MKRQLDHEHTFTFMTEDGAIIPGMPLLSASEEGFLNDTYIVIEQKGRELCITDVQNWRNQRFQTVKHKYQYRKSARSVCTSDDESAYVVEETPPEPLSFSKLANASSSNQVLLRSTDADDKLFEVHNAMGTVYIFVLLANLSRSMVYRRLRGSLTANLIEATVTFKDIGSSSEWSRRRGVDVVS